MLSGIGEPYDFATGKGVLGRNLTHEVYFGVTAFFEKPLNRFMGAGAAGICISDFEGDVFDHANLPFLRGGALLALSLGFRPIANFGVVPRTVNATWGSQWKKAAVHYYDRTGIIWFNGEHLAYKGNYMDFDLTVNGDGSGKAEISGGHTEGGSRK